MSKYSVLWAFTFSLISTQVFADWIADASVLDSQAGLGTTQAITSYKAGIDIYQPPQPCVDTNKESFQLGSPATLSCSGGSSGGPNPAGGGATDTLQQTNQNQNSGVFQ